MPFEQIHSNGLQRIIHYIHIINRGRRLKGDSTLQTMELIVLAVIVGISGGLAARLTPRKG